MPKKKPQTNEQLSMQADIVESCDFATTDLYKRGVFRTEAEFCNPTYIRKNGVLFTNDSLQWFKALRDESVDLIFADPPYNIKKADWDRFDSQEQYIQWSIKWIAEAARVLKTIGQFIYMWIQ